MVRVLVAFAIFSFCFSSALKLLYLTFDVISFLFWQYPILERCFVRYYKEAFFFHKSNRNGNMVLSNMGHSLSAINSGSVQSS